MPQFALFSPRFIIRLTFIAILLTLTACHGTPESSHELRVGVVAGPDNSIVSTVKTVAKKRYGLDIKIVEFNDYVTPNTALADGSIDANAFQTGPFLDALQHNRPLNLIAVGHTFTYPMGGYSKRYNKLADLPDGAIISLPNDPANQARGLILLAKHGLIQIKNINDPGTGLDDITANPHHYKFHEVEGPQLPRTLDDVDLAFINNTFAQPIGLTIHNALLHEDGNSIYVNIIATRKELKDDPRIKEFVAAYQSEPTLIKARELFGDGAIAGWSTNHDNNQSTDKAPPAHPAK